MKIENVEMTIKDAKTLIKCLQKYEKFYKKFTGSSKEDYIIRNIRDMIYDLKSLIADVL